MGGDVAKAQCCKRGEGKINAIHQAAIEVAIKVPPALGIVHKIIGKCENPDFYCVGDKCEKHPQHNAKAVFHMHGGHAGSEPVQKLVMKHDR